jgi:hypothetical protein
VVGVAAAFFLRKVMASLLYGLSANDPVILSVVPLVIVLGSCWPVTCLPVAPPR